MDIGLSGHCQSHEKSFHPDRNRLCSRFHGCELCFHQSLWIGRDCLRFFFELIFISHCTTRDCLEVYSMSPVISVCVLSWNHAPYVVQCLQSICQQTFSNLEIVYLDNHSSDNTFDVAQAFLEKQHVSFQA